MDIQGEIEYNAETLNVRVKGELVPWLYYTDTNETDLSELSDDQVKQYEELFNKYINDALTITIGFYPLTDEYDDESATSEEFNDNQGEYHYVENGKLKQFNFTFNSEINN